MKIKAFAVGVVSTVTLVSATAPVASANPGIPIDVAVSTAYGAITDDSVGDLRAVVKQADKKSKVRR